MSGQKAIGTPVNAHGTFQRIVHSGVDMNKNELGSWFPIRSPTIGAIITITVAKLLLFVLFRN